MTPHQAQWGQQPRRVWERYVDKDLMKEEKKINHGEIYQKIRRKGEKRAQKHNGEKQQVRFSIGDLVLIRTNPISDLTNKITAKFCELYEGPYKIKDIKGGATYVVAEVDNLGSVRGIFNVRQMKPYYHG